MIRNMLGRKGRILRRLVGCIFAGVLWCVSSVAASVACTGWTYYDSELEACATCENQGFTINTTNLAANTEFWVSISPKGSFTIDWGDGTSDTISSGYEVFKHTYSTANLYTIKVTGPINNWSCSSSSGCALELKGISK